MGLNNPRACSQRPLRMWSRSSPRELTALKRTPVSSSSAARVCDSWCSWKNCPMVSSTSDELTWVCSSSSSSTQTYSRVVIESNQDGQKQTLLSTIRKNNQTKYKIKSIKKNKRKIKIE